MSTDVERALGPEGHMDMGRQRLPTLLEVLARRTMSPVDLFSFYVYMRDQQRSVDYLDFWLDVSQHMALCRHFVRELRRSVLFETPDLDKAGSKRSSQILNDFERTPEQGPSRSMRSNLSAPRELLQEQASRKSEDQQVTSILRNDTRSQHGSHHSQKDSSETNKSRDTTPLEQPRPSFMASQFGDSSGNNSSPQHTVTRADLRASAEKILYTYLLPGSMREIVLPHATLEDITHSVEDEGRDDPEVFDVAKEYVFQAMERDAFPGFLRTKALGNLVPPSIMLRLIVGLISGFGAFWAAFIVVFLNKMRETRLWLILPFAFGVYYIACHQYTLDPILALFGYSELTFFSFVRINEPFVRKLINKRSLVELFWIFCITAAFVVLFVFVPGRRL